jgi:hypothetical protein
VPRRYLLPGIALAFAVWFAACSPQQRDTLDIPAGLPGATDSATTELPPGHPPLPGTGAETLPGMPRDHALPPPAHPTRSGMPARLEVPAEVKATWKSVELSATVAGQARALRVAVGAEAAIPDSGLTVRVIAFLPALQVGEGVITSNGNNPDNPAVLLRISEGGKALAEGWVFQKYPDFSAPETNRVKLRLMSAQRY